MIHFGPLSSPQDIAPLSINPPFAVCARRYDLLEGEPVLRHTATPYLYSQVRASPLA